MSRYLRRIGPWAAAGMGLAAVSYAAYVSVAFMRYGRPGKAKATTTDPLLDIFMSDYDVVDRQSVRVDAPAERTLATAAEMDLGQCTVVRAIFKGREIILGAKPDGMAHPTGLIAQAKSMGWRVLAELPGHEIVVGAVTKPWEANPIFIGLAPDEFKQFHEPGYVKILWTLRADSFADNTSLFRTETRAVATDVEARRKFRRYWSLLSPGIVAIRKAMLPALKAEAERQWGLPTLEIHEA